MLGLLFGRFLIAWPALITRDAAGFVIQPCSQVDEPAALTAERAPSLLRRPFDGFAAVGAFHVSGVIRHGSDCSCRIGKVLVSAASDDAAGKLEIHIRRGLRRAGVEIGLLQEPDREAVLAA